MKKILIVEDEEILSDMYSDIFAKEGFEVFSASSPQEALEVTKSKKPDFILLDILLLHGSGLSFLAEKNKNPTLQKISVVVFSNFDDPETKRKSMAMGAKDYLIKTNYTPQEVVERVKSLL